MWIFRKKQKQIALVSIIFLLLGVLTGCSNASKQEPEAASHNWPTDDTTISLYQHETGETVEMTLREYLYGVVAGEMDVNWPVEALAANCGGTAVKVASEPSIT